MANEKSGRFEMVTPPGWMEKIDAWRAQQPGIPSRAEAIRRLVDKGLESGGWAQQIVDNLNRHTRSS